MNANHVRPSELGTTELVAALIHPVRSWTQDYLSSPMSELARTGYRPSSSGVATELETDPLCT